MIYTVYYQRFFGLLKPAEQQWEWLEFTHRLVGQVKAEMLEQVFWHMQGLHWSPQGEARPLIEALHLSHTSLSIGDVVKDPQGTYWICNLVGWLPLPSEPFRSNGQPRAKPPLWMATEADLQVVPPRITRLKISDERDCLSADSYTVERCGRIAFNELVTLARLIEQRLGLSVCIDLGDQFYETEANL